MNKNKGIYLPKNIQWKNINVSDVNYNYIQILDYSC